MASAEGTESAAVATEEYVNTVADRTAGAAVKRYFTIPGRDPFEELEWELRDAFIAGKDKPTFEQKGVEFPKFWSQTATNIVAQKYFRGRMSSPERESSVKQMIGRVVDTIAGWGREGGYFASEDEAETFEAELKFILVNQLAAFNSPVWFNVGFEERPQCSACFILSIDGARESSSAAARAPASTSPSFAPPRSSSPRAATRAARSRSCAVPMLPPERSSPAARHGARRRWSCSMWTTPISRSSSGARRARSRRRACSSRPATTCRSTRPTGPRSSTRTRTTRCASPTHSWRPSRPSPSGT